MKSIRNAILNYLVIKYEVNSSIIGKIRAGEAGNPHTNNRDVSHRQKVVREAVI